MEYFKNVKKIEFEGIESTNPFAFRYYDKERIVLGKPMKEHLKFAVAYWHTFVANGVDMFGDSTMVRPWNENNEMETAKNKVEAAFELMEKLGVEYFCFHDVDIAPAGKSLEEFFKNLDEITDLMLIKMEETGIKLLWNTANLFTHPRYVNGALTSPNVEVYAYAAAQIKKSLELNKKLNGTSFVFWGGREGYESLLNTDLELEQDNMARMLKMAADYAESINHDTQLLIEPKPKEPTSHQYDYDALTTLSFLQKYNLDDKFKLNLEANHATLAGHTFEHELRFARVNGMLGSIDANQGNPLIGWDIDEFPTNAYDTTLAMYEVYKNGGLQKGGINFDAKVRRSSLDVEDLMLAHIAGMDTYARGLLAVEKLEEDKFFDKIISDRYKSFDSHLGQKVLSDDISLEELSNFALENQEIKNDSDRLEHIKAILNDYIV